MIVQGLLFLMYRELLIGCGHRKTRKLLAVPNHENWANQTTADFNIDCNPNVVLDLEKLPLPFKDNIFDEIHAYEVLEHTGTQGDWRFFFDQFSEFHRILKPNGYFFASVPSWKSQWAWGDPSHKRIITEGTLSFLSQEEYIKQIGKTAMSDFRFYYKADFRAVYLDANFEDGQYLVFCLKAIK